jgi:type VI secretion system protein ImpA
MTIEDLLQPVRPEAPCGDDLSFSHEFDAIAELRREDDPTLDQGEWVTALKTADWAGTQKRCGELLVSSSKDLRLAMWWAEAAALTSGYAGLHTGLQLCTALCQRYWDGLYPEVEDGDMEQRIGNIAWFLNRTVTLATRAPLTQGRGGAAYSITQMQAARALQATLDRHPEQAAALQSDAITVDKVNRALRETPKEALRDAVRWVDGCLSALAQWQEVIDAQLGQDGPSFVPAREALAGALHEVQRVAKEAGALLGESIAPSASGGSVHAASAGAEAAGPAGAAAGLGGPPRSREQALAQLREVATFFRATEPHSPVAYLAEKAVQWGDMPLHVWLRTVLKDPGALSHVEELLGVLPQSDNAA